MERLQKIHQILIFSLYTAVLAISFLILFRARERVRCDAMCIIVDFYSTLSLKRILIYEAFSYRVAVCVCFAGKEKRVITKQLRYVSY